MKGDATCGVIGDGEAILFEGEEIAGEEIAIFAAGEEADFGGRRVGALGEGNAEQFGDIEVDCGGGGGGLPADGFAGGSWAEEAAELVTIFKEEEIEGLGIGGDDLGEVDRAKGGEGEGEIACEGGTDVDLTGIEAEGGGAEFAAMGEADASDGGGRIGWVGVGSEAEEGDFVAGEGRGSEVDGVGGDLGDATGFAFAVGEDDLIIARADIGDGVIDGNEAVPRADADIGEGEFGGLAPVLRLESEAAAIFAGVGFLGGPFANFPTIDEDDQATGGAIFKDLPAEFLVFGLSRLVGRFGESGDEFTEIDLFLFGARGVLGPEEELGFIDIEANHADSVAPDRGFGSMEEDLVGAVATGEIDIDAVFGEIGKGIEHPSDGCGLGGAEGAIAVGPAAIGSPAGGGLGACVAFSGGIFGEVNPFDVGAVNGDG